MEKFDLQPSTPEPLSSREAVIVKDLKEKHAELESLSEEEVRSLLSTNRKMKMFALTEDKVIDEMKNFGYFKEIPPIKDSEEIVPAEPEMISNYLKLQGITEVEDEEIKQQLEQNKFYEELANNIFKNDKDIDMLYDQAIALEKNFPSETKEYYEGFVDLVEGGMEEIERDLQNLAATQERFKNDTGTLGEDQAKKKEKLKKIATIVECGIVHAVTNVGWYGDSVSIEPVCQFNDVKRGVDGVLQIIEQDQNIFLALGVDATYRGLLSQEYKVKFYKLLASIAEGYKTKIKYFKNHQRQMMREFPVPKIVLYLDSADVKHLVGMIRDTMEPDETKDFKNDPRKIELMNQILIQCELLAGFAEECGNNVFENYDDFIGAVKRLGQENPEIQAIIDSSHENEVSTHMRYLISEFKKGRLASAA